jgi:hypothetical protein
VGNERVSLSRLGGLSERVDADSAILVHCSSLSLASSSDLTSRNRASFSHVRAR